MFIVITVCYKLYVTVYTCYTYCIHCCTILLSIYCVSIAYTGLPIVLSCFLPGQEAGNVPYVVEGGFGLYNGMMCVLCIMCICIMMYILWQFVYTSMTCILHNVMLIYTIFRYHTLWCVYIHTSMACVLYNIMFIYVHILCFYTPHIPLPSTILTS